MAALAQSDSDSWHCRACGSIAVRRASRRFVGVSVTREHQIQWKWMEREIRWMRWNVSHLRNATFSRSMSDESGPMENACASLSYLWLRFFPLKYPFCVSRVNCGRVEFSDGDWKYGDPEFGSGRGGVHFEAERRFGYRRQVFGRFVRPWMFFYSKTPIVRYTVSCRTRDEYCDCPNIGYMNVVSRKFPMSKLQFQFHTEFQ